MKLAILEQKFDEIKRDGLLLPTALSAGKFLVLSIFYISYDLFASFKNI